MNTKSSGPTTLAIFLLITFLSFVLLVLGMTSLWMTLRASQPQLDLMSTIGALSTALGAAAVFGAGFFAYRELSEVANSRNMDIADRLFTELNDPENVEARRVIFQDLADNPAEEMENLPAGHRAAMKRVLNSLDRVAFLTQSGWIPDELIMPWMHPMIAKSWARLEPYVLYERQRRNEPYYYQNVGRLAERCRTWRAKNLSSTEIKWVDKAL